MVPLRIALGTFLAAVALVAAGSTQAAFAKSKVSPVPANAGKGAVAPLSGQGRWFVDAAGRVVQLRGVNEVYKSAPYYPAADGFGADDATMLSRQGFNVVRLGVDFRGLMPAPGKPSEQYIANLSKTVNQLTRAGIYTLVDFHQDGFSPKYNGNGFPDWWAIDDGLANPDLPFPTYYIGNPALQRAFEHFWDNSKVAGKGIQEWFLQGMKAVVKRFRSNPHVIGYEAFNEPWPGADWSTCLSPTTGCPDLERERIVPFARKAVAMTRKLTRRQPVFVEPFVLFNYGTPTMLPGSTGAWLAGHDYASNDAGDVAVVNQMLTAARRDRKPAIITEFGATNDPGTLERLTAHYDDGLMSWIFWAYNENVVTDQSVPTTRSVANRDVLRALVRPYPVALAGTPTRVNFDPDSRVMTLKYTKRRPGGGKYPARLPSVIAVQQLTYPEGYTAKVTGAVIRSRPCSQRLVLRNGPKAAKPVTVKITPGGTCS